MSDNIDVAFSEMAGSHNYMIDRYTIIIQTRLVWVKYTYTSPRYSIIRHRTVSHWKVYPRTNIQVDF